MAKGSQLSQLKSALIQAGVIGQNNSGKKRKRSTPVEKDKNKKAVKLDEIHRRLNPFDVKVTKLKHDVGGRRLKGITGKPAQSKQAGIEQRKKTLLKEYEQKDRAGGIVDRRFGENNPDITVEERMLERFTKERQRASKGAAFNLEDEDELTHYGQSLSKLDDFDDIGLDSDDEEDEASGQIGRDIVSKTHFGGFSDDEEGGEPARKKSKAEVMAEVIAKSKEHKLRRQMEREHGDNVRHELDNGFADLRSLIFAPDAASGSNSILIDRSQGRVFTSSNSTDAPIVALTPEMQDVDYDQHVRELAFDRRSKAKDRTKTEEELALEAKETLETAERRRQRRMLGLNESDSEDEEGKGKGKGKRKRKRGGDDLVDDFYEENREWDGLGVGLGEKRKEGVGELGNQEDSASNGDEDDGGSVVDDSDDSVDENNEPEELVQSAKTDTSKRKAKSKMMTELPYTFSCPTNHEEFLEIIDGVEENDVHTVVQRIRALYHTNLASDNKFKLQVLGNVLIDHILHAGSSTQPRLALITILYPHLKAIIQAYPIPAAQHFNHKLTLMHKNLKHGLARGPLNTDSKTWPGLPELFLLRVIGQIWPTSDLNHAVMSPTRVLLGAYLGLCRVRSLSDLASGLFLCTLYLQYESISKRLVPEAINFLLNAVLHLAPHRFKDTASLPGSFPSPDFQSQLCRPLLINAKSFKMTGPRREPNLLILLASQSDDEQAKIDLLSLSLELLGRFSIVYKGLDGFIELYEPVLEVLDGIDSKRVTQLIQPQLSKLSYSLQRLLKFARQSRQPLRLQSHKPIPIPTYIPKFETTSSNYLRRQDPDYEKNEASKLRNLYKQEKKGAIRELRKDARFLANVEQQKQLEKDKSYNDRMKRVFGSIEGERAEEKAMEREKSKEKRRAGKK